MRVTSAAESAARDTAAIAGGIPSRALMERAGAAAAAEIALRCTSQLDDGVLVYAGPGNNGGDAWVVARALAAVGIRVRVCEVVEARTPDARAERALAAPHVAMGAWQGERIVIDGLLGTGTTGEPRGAIAESVRHIATARAAGATVVALDLPTGVDATTGDATRAVSADLTLTFGTIKRGHLIARGHCGAIVVLDIGLGAFAEIADGAPVIVDERWFHAAIPAIPAVAHKGIRKKLVVIGGAEGMAGAAILAARAAMRSGIGMVRLLVAPESLGAVQAAEPFALAGVWPTDDAALQRELLDWADALVLGPGLGRSDAAGSLVDRALARFRGPVLLDADALNHFAGRLDALHESLGDRPALLTPHPAECARLAATTVDDVLARRFEIGADVARQSGATVLLKGVPTVITAPDGTRLVSATGTPVLAAAGSGDILSGIAGTLLAQTGDAVVAGTAGAWAHGWAAEMAGEAGGGRREASRDEGRATRDAWDLDLDENLDAESSRPSPVATRPFDAPHPSTRGHTLDDVLESLPAVWSQVPGPPRYPVLLDLPPVPTR